jgi:hypothetical protein
VDVDESGASVTDDNQDGASGSGTSSETDNPFA